MYCKCARDHSSSVVGTHRQVFALLPTFQKSCTDVQKEHVTVTKLGIMTVTKSVKFIYFKKIRVCPMYLWERTGVVCVEVMFDVCSIPLQISRAATWGQWRTEGVCVCVCVQTPHPEIPKFWQSWIWLQIEQKMFSVPIPTSQLV